MAPSALEWWTWTSTWPLRRLGHELLELLGAAPAGVVLRHRRREPQHVLGRLGEDVAREERHREQRHETELVAHHVLLF